ncbi:hypothetical protein P3X46_022329 [Hevea brasiliensis]|uniref:Uncharacterized protein n=1 Tax=Hevea brasiliensis TaxID=3981 RepID=A0ABQ9L7J7_HEVBR|nr:hypothetical protein P3X46_022329 [Hevea brasiliensis]
MCNWAWGLDSARAAEEEMEKAEGSKKTCCKRKISKSETSSITMNIPSFLSYTGNLLQRRCPDTACWTAKIVGPASLLSLEMNERIALDIEIVKFFYLSFKEIGFLQVPFSSTLVYLCTKDNRSVASQPEKVPRNLSEAFFVFLKKLWTKVLSQMLLCNPLISIPERHLCIANITINYLSEGIFRLSTTAIQFAPLPSLLVQRKIFGWSEDKASPFIVRRPSTSIVEEDDIFSLFAESLNYKESSYSFLSPVFQSFISCLPITSGESDILNFLEEVGNELGIPIIYQISIFSSIDDIMKCEEAFKEGYTHADDFGSGELARLSLHIAFVIEWNLLLRFAHVALQRWSQTREKANHALVEPLSGLFNVITVNLFHAMIELMGAFDPTFRKACFAGAPSLPFGKEELALF